MNFHIPDMRRQHWDQTISDLVIDFQKELLMEVGSACNSKKTEDYLGHLSLFVFKVLALV